MDMQISAEVLNAAAFVTWLNAHGHNAATHPRTGNFIDGVWTAVDEDAARVIADLYRRFQNDSR